MPDFTPPTRMRSLARAINDKIEKVTGGMWRVGTVTAISLPTVTVTLDDGGSLTLPKLANYSPAINDVVQIAWPKNRPFILGKIG